METTSVDTVYYNGFKVLMPGIVRITKMMSCGHLGLFLGDRWTCQTCWGFELQEVESLTGDCLD